VCVTQLERRLVESAQYHRVDRESITVTVFTKLTGRGLRACSHGYVAGPCVRPYRYKLQATFTGSSGFQQTYSVRFRFVFGVISDGAA